MHCPSPAWDDGPGTLIFPFRPMASRYARFCLSTPSKVARQPLRWLSAWADHGRFPPGSADTKCDVSYAATALHFERDVTRAICPSASDLCGWRRCLLTGGPVMRWRSMNAPERADVQCCAVTWWHDPEPTTHSSLSIARAQITQV